MDTVVESASQITKAMQAGFSSPHVSLPSDWFESVGSVVGAAGRGLLVTDAAGTICQTNERLSEIVGYAPSELVGKNPRIFRSGNTAAATYAKMWNELSSGRSWRGVLQNRKKNGATFLEDITISPIKASSGEITHFLGLIDPIEPTSRQFSWVTEEDRKDSILWVSKGIAHEINNALTGILGNCSFVSRDLAPSSDAAQRIETISSIAYRLNAFSNRVSLCAGLPLMDRDRIDLNKQVVDALDEMEASGDLSQVLCDLAEYPIYVDGSATLIQQAVKEFVSNALDSRTPAEQDITVSISYKFWDEPAFAEGTYSKSYGLEPGEVACIEIVDRGTGMEPSLLELSTEMFFSTKRTNSGLGTPVALGIINSHHGAIEISSSDRKGTRARLFFRLSES